MWASSDARFCGYCRYQLSTVPGYAQQLEYAGFWIRLVAFIIDGIILSIIGAVISFATTDVLSVIFLQFLARAVYHIGFWVGQGATPGKMAVGVKVVMKNGEPIELGAACLRYFGYIVSTLFFFIGFLMIAFTAEKRGLHDNIANTIVVKFR